MSEAGASVCPRCIATIGAEARRCASCGLGFERVGGILDVIGAQRRQADAARVEEFYTAHPFPGYAPGDDAPTLIDRSRRSPFLVALDEAIPPDALVADCGCGTGQLAAFLALAAPRRRVIAVDGCLASLQCADGFRARARVENLQLVRGDLFDLPLGARRFPVVLSRGVVHHTPDPDRAIAAVAERVAPGGILLLGFYETMGRAVHRARRALGELRGRPIRFLDPILRRADLDEEKKRIWIADQYEHPLEHVLALPRVVRVLARAGFEWIRSVPPAANGSELFGPDGARGSAATWRLRLGWMVRGLADPDAGLVFVVARRHSGT